MDDSDVLSHIAKLVHDEQKFAQMKEQGGLTEDQRASLRQIEIYLDQCWDLLRQRRARRIASLDPADARLHDEESTELFPQ
jgi:hypothetical protein